MSAASSVEPFELFHVRLAFFEQAFHPVACLAASSKAKRLEHFFETVDLHAGDFEVFFERRAEFIAFHGLRHLWQGLCDLLFGVVHIPEFLDKQFLKIFSCHCDSFRRARRARDGLGRTPGRHAMKYCSKTCASTDAHAAAAARIRCVSTVCTVQMRLFDRLRMSRYSCARFAINWPRYFRSRCVL